MPTRDAASATTLLEFRTELDAPMDRVFATLTESAHLARWLSDEATSDPAAGGRVVLGWKREGSSTDPFSGRWVVFQPPTSCAFEGGHPGHPDGYGGRIGFEIAPRGATGSVLITRHRLPTRLDYEPVIADYRTAWPRALERLVAYLTPAV